MWDKYSGIPRYFCELIREYQSSDEVVPHFPKGYCQNRDYRDLLSFNKVPCSWRVRDTFLTISKKTIHRDPSAYISNIQKHSLSLLDSGDYDVFHPTHFSQYYAQTISHSNKPIVLTVYDFTFEQYSEYYSPKVVAKVIHETELSLNNATRIICISNYTKDELIKTYGVDPSVIDVIYLGLPSINNNIIQSWDKSSDSPYLLYVGVRRGHKNFYTFVLSIKEFLLKNGLRLICAGSPFTSGELAYLKALGLENIVIAIQANNQVLSHLYLEALAFIFPSVNEGFGFPVLEAFSCGCPVICSGGSCFPEIAGDAAMYFNPKDVASILDAVEHVVSDEKLRNQMRERGYKQLEKFSWKKCAEETKTVYEKAME